MNGRLRLMTRLADAQPSGRIVPSVVALMLTVGALDYITGWELSFSVFYTVPVAVAAWYLGRRMTWTVAFTCALVWLAVNALAGQQYHNPLIPYWNTLVRFAFFVIIAEVLLALRMTLAALRSLIGELEATAAREMELSRTDSLTGARNARAFYEAVEVELQRSRRYNRSMCIAYLDADGFKAINDSLGHAEGDRLLKTTATTLAEVLRKSDCVARLGGDEFSLLFPETDEVALFCALEKVQSSLGEQMQRNGWAVTYSIGGVCCPGDCETSVAELVHAADQVMYEVKRQGRNSLRIKTLAATPA